MQQEVIDIQVSENQRSKGKWNNLKDLESDCGK